MNEICKFTEEEKKYLNGLAIGENRQDIITELIFLKACPEDKVVAEEQGNIIDGLIAKITEMDDKTWLNLCNYLPLYEEI